MQDAVRGEAPVQFDAVDDEFLVFDVGRGGARTQQEGHRLRDLVFCALGVHLARHGLAQAPYLEQFGQFGGAGRAHRQQGDAVREGQQVG